MIMCHRKSLFRVDDAPPQPQRFHVDEIEGDGFKVICM